MTEEEVLEDFGIKMDDGSPSKNNNPEKVLEAILNPSPLTMSQMALLERIDSPYLKGEIPTWEDALAAIWVTSVDPKEAVAHYQDAKDQAVVWAKDLSHDEFTRKSKELILGISAFWNMLPGADDDSKKKLNSTRTDGLPS